MNEEYLWQLLNVVPPRFLNSNIEGNLQNVAEDDRVPQRFIPCRPRRWISVQQDPRVPLRFLKTDEQEALLRVQEMQNF